MESSKPKERVKDTTSSSNEALRGLEAEIRVLRKIVRDLINLSNIAELKLNDLELNKLMRC